MPKNVEDLAKLEIRQCETAENSGDDRDERDERAVLQAQDGEFRHDSVSHGGG